jgi:lysozyme
MKGPHNGNEKVLAKKINLFLRKLLKAIRLNLFMKQPNDLRINFEKEAEEMNDDFFEKELEILRRHEGFRSRPYKDTVGVLTIGFGRNLHKGITKDEAEILLKGDYYEALIECYDRIPCFASLNRARRHVLVNMMFNLGSNRFMGFKKMLKALELNDYQRASEEMLDSKWASQVGNRSKELSNIMRSGEIS